MRVLPGWQNSNADHRPTPGARSFNFKRVEQAGWHGPRRGDSIARLEEVLLEPDAPAVLVAHRLGRQLLVAGALGPLHGDSGLADWPQALAPAAAEPATASQPHPIDRQKEY